MRNQLHFQRGMTLVEFMVAITIGMLMVAALATLVANQSQSRTEIDKAGRMIENGRYAVATISGDLQLAGYYGEMDTSLVPSVPASLPDPCSTAASAISAALPLHVQGYNAPTTLPSDLATCVKNHRAGTDVIVIRRADPDVSDLQTSGAVDWTKVKAGQVYLQTGLSTSGANFEYALAAATGSNDSVTFEKLRKDKAAKATPKRFYVRIYYISKCSVPTGSGGTCTTSDDNGTWIPTLKRVDLSYSGSTTAFTTLTIAEGIENLQVDYGVDTDADGYPDSTLNGGACITSTSSYPNATCTVGAAFTTIDWNNVMSATVYLIARSGEKVAGFTDSNTYQLGTAAAAPAPAGEEAYRRRVFTQSIKFVNPVGRRVF